MFIYWLILALCVIKVESAVQNVSCQEVPPRELDWKELDGKWYLAAVATDLDIDGDCAMVMFNHLNTTDISISWITNNTMSYYNGSVALIEDPDSNNTGDLLTVTYNDNKYETYSFLDVDYEHYAVVFACYNNDDGNSSTYEIWKLTRSPNLKDAAAKLDQAIANYNLQDTKFHNFNNTEYTCKINGAVNIEPSAIVITTVTAFTLLRRMY